MEQKNVQVVPSPSVDNHRVSISGETESLWTVDDVARYLQLEPERVRVKARKQEIPALKLPNSNRWRFRKVEVEQWVSDWQSRRTTKETLDKV